MFVSIARLIFAALFMCTWGLIATTSGSVDTHAQYIDVSKEETAVSESIQEDTVEQKITANVMVDDMEETIVFYRDVLGFEMAMNAPEEPPYEWVMMSRWGGSIMFQTRESMAGENPVFKDMPIGGSFGLFIVVDDVKALDAAVKGKAEVVKGLTKQFYGMLELTIKDPNGYILTFAQPIQE